MGSSRSARSAAGRERLRWTQELHDRFIEAVTKLGGPDSMGNTKGYFEGYERCWTDHLPFQKPLAEGKLQRKNISEMLPNFGATSAAQLNEALKIMQIQVQRRLSDQNEVQRSLKHKFEVQGRFLDKISAERHNNNKSRPILITKPSKVPLPRASLPSLCDDSESNANDFVSDSEAERSEIQSSVEQFQALKWLRLHHQNDDVQLALNSEFYNAQSHSLLLPHEDLNVDSYPPGA